MPYLSIEELMQYTDDLSRWQSRAFRAEADLNHHKRALEYAAREISHGDKKLAVQWLEATKDGIFIDARL